MNSFDSLNVVEELPLTQDKQPQDEKQTDHTRGSNVILDNALITRFEGIATRSQINRLQERIDLVNKTMDEFIETNQGDPEILFEAANHLLIAGGKRFRSLLSILVCEAVGGNPEDSAPIALAEELFQTASLIHDDIIDKDDLRRGVETVHRKYGEQIAIVAGDLLIAQAIRLLGEYGTPELIAHIGRGGVKMCRGEVADYLYVADEADPLSTTEYLMMINLKTVSFMREAVRSGASFGHASDSQMHSLIDYAEMLGFAYQIRDDILDVTSSTRGTGKSVLSDLKKRGINYLLIHALESVSEHRRNQCLQELAQGNIKDALDLIVETNAVQHAEDLAYAYVSKAKDALKGHNLVQRDLLELLADYAIIRER